MHFRPRGEALCVSRDEKGLDELTGRLVELPVALVVLEATGGFETTVAASLAAAGLPLCCRATEDIGVRRQPDLRAVGSG